LKVLLLNRSFSRCNSAKILRTKLVIKGAHHHITRLVAKMIEDKTKYRFKILHLYKIASLSCLVSAKIFFLFFSLASGIMYNIRQEKKKKKEKKKNLNLGARTL
jgi:hypothetical protein